MHPFDMTVHIFRSEIKDSAPYSSWHGAPIVSIWVFSCDQNYRDFFRCVCHMSVLINRSETPDGTQSL